MTGCIVRVSKVLADTVTQLQAAHRVACILADEEWLLCVAGPTRAPKCDAFQRAPEQGAAQREQAWRVDRTLWERVAEVHDP
jgi:hypothetical protein